MRTTKELFTLVRYYCRPLMLQGCRGLCHVVFQMRYDHIIDVHETHNLLNYIRDNKPSIFSRHYSWRNSYSEEVAVYHWVPGEIKPREKWLDAQIKKL